MEKNKPVASVSLDLDNKWSYLKTHGDPSWESFPSYLDIVVPRVLNFLQEYGHQITFFIVGQDAALEENHAALAAISQAGHEIGNHSFNHEPWLHLYSEPAIEAELARAEEYITQVTGQKPIGFRGPGYSCSESVLRVLARRHYLYDASTLPTFLGPLARAYYFMTTRLTPEEKQERKKLFGTFKEGQRPVKPYRWRLEGVQSGSELIEIPVTTMPVFKVPVHASYVLYLSLFSPAMALLYFRTFLVMCRLTGVQPSLLLHPLDFMDRDDAADLSFFPAMALPHPQKMKLVGKLLQMLSSQFTIVTMQQHAREILATAAVHPLTELSFNLG